MTTITNDERSRAEVAAFIAEPPARYFAYRVGDMSKISTWTGDMLATVQWAGKPFKSCFGDTRQNFRALAVNGKTYAGTSYLSAGDYVRMRAVNP